MCMPSPTPIFFMRLANFVGDGSMWGSEEVSSAISSMSKKRAPGMCACRNSALASRLVVGKCIEPSRITRSGASRCEASQSVSTSHLSAALAMPFSSPTYGFRAASGAPALAAPGPLLRGTGRSPPRRLREGHADAPVQLTLLFDLTDHDAANFCGRSHMRAAARLQINRAVLANSDEPHLATAHRGLHRHCAHELWICFKLGVADPALGDGMVGPDQRVELAGQAILVHRGGILDVKIEAAFLGAHLTAGHGILHEGTQEVQAGMHAHEA